VDSTKPAEKNEKPAKEEPPRKRQSKVTLAGKPVSYTAQTGTVPILKEDDTARASVFYVYYAAEDGTGARLCDKDPTRPIMFCFNGGPGASAVWLHLGGLGPRRVNLPPEGLSPAQVGLAVDNPNSILDAADLVFVDPVSTGLSRSAKGEKPEQFFGVDEDVQALGEFVRLFTTREKRWSSAKYLCGESYGVLRVAGLAHYLQQSHGWYPEGLVLLSGLVDFQTLWASDGNELPYILFLPTMTATAHFHKRLDPALGQDLEKAVADSRAFAQGEYALALLKGNALSNEEKSRVARRLAGFTGLAEAEVLRQNLRISPGYFRKALLVREEKVLGRFDARVVGEDSDPGQMHPSGDPSYDNIAGAFASAINAYVRGELGFESDHPYHILKGLPWKYHQFEGRYVSTASRLEAAIRANPNLKTLVLCGRRDLAVPEDSMRYSVSHLRLHPDLQKSIRFSLYESGHMMYLNAPDAVKLRKDLTEFVRQP
jgi:carboxypeptidase C (cathepsin A)